MSNNHMIDLYPLILEAFSQGLTFKFPVNGTSMRPLLKAQDAVTIEKVSEVKKGDIVLFRRDDGHFVLHRVRKIHHDLYDIVGDHQTGIERNIRYDQLIGKVISYSKKDEEKEHNLKNFRYRVYKLFVRLKIIRFLNSKLA